MIIHFPPERAVFAIFVHIISLLYYRSTDIKVKISWEKDGYMNDSINKHILMNKMIAKYILKFKTSQ